MERNDRVPPDTVPAVDPATPPMEAAAEANGSGPANTVEMARQVAAAVQDLVRRLGEQDGYRRQLESRLRAYEEQARMYEPVMQALSDLARSGISEDDLQTLQRVIEALARDPNHIMVLASVAQQANKLQTVVNSFQRLLQSARNSVPQA